MPSWSAYLSEPVRGVASLIGRSLGHFRVLSKIGEGGRGEVYRALDTKLDREVALKIVPREMVSDPDG